MSSTLIEKFKRLLGERVLTGSELSERYVHIWKMAEGLRAKAMLLPKSTEEVSAIMKICSEYNQPVIVFGGLTNLVGSTETNGDEVIISTEKLNVIEEVDVSSRAITVQSGVVLEEIQNAARKHDLLFPLNFGAKGSAQIGGVISTNAGGLRVFRFGMTRALVLGLEVVLADGTILSSMKKIIKDNSAYDLKQLFVGSEGTLGIVTKAVMKLVELPKSRTSAFVGVNKFENVVKFLKHMDKGMAGTLSGFELIWGVTYKKMTTFPSSMKPPIPHGFKYYVLVEGLGNDKDRDLEILESHLETALENEIVQDAAIAYNESELHWFWNIREDVHVLSSSCVNDQHFDISLPIPNIGDAIDSIYNKLLTIKGVREAYPFGHIADGNIHFIVDRLEDRPELVNEINDVVYGPINKLGGSVSAEHGIGLHKKRYLNLCRTNAEIQVMKSIKKSLDPKLLLNPGKVLDL